MDTSRRIDELYFKIIANCSKVHEKAKAQGSIELLESLLNLSEQQLNKNQQSLKRIVDNDQPDDVKRKCVEEQKNWNDLPPEIKLMCVKNLDYKDRARLAMTSRTEKALVQNKRYEWEKVVVILKENKTWSDDFDVHAMKKNGEELTYESDFDESPPGSFAKSLAFLGHVLKYGKIETLTLRGDDNNLLAYFDQFRDLDKCAPFQFSRLETFGKMKLAHLLLERNECPVDFIRFTGPTCDFVRLPLLPKFTETKMLEITRDNCSRKMDSSDFASPLLEAWIERDVPIGTRAAFVIFNPHYSEFSFYDFSDRLVDPKKKGDILHNENRIRTNDESKHIWVRCGYHEPRDSSRYYLVTCRVIPADLSDADLEDYVDDEYGTKITYDAYESDFSEPSFLGGWSDDDDDDDDDEDDDEANFFFNF